MDSLEKFKQVVSGGYCIGCGACAYMASDRIRMQCDRYGMVQAELDDAGLYENKAADILQVCPFTDSGPNEDQLADILFPDTHQDVRVGRYKSLYAGHVAEGEFWTRGSSGGVVSWILAELLKKKMADKVMHVAPVVQPGDRLFAYRISTSEEELLQGAKSKYYPIELSQVLEHVRSQEGRYVLVGVPCFIKAVRRLALLDAVIQERIVFYIGLVCGHLKSKAFADCIAWQAGMEPGLLEAVDFRVKLPERLASEYGVTVRGAEIEKTEPVADYFGANWGYGFFKYSACEYCDDVFAETADVSVGDAWLPEFTADHRGNSVVLARSKAMEALLNAAQREGRLNLQSCTAEKMAESQAGGLRDRREGLAYRLYLKECAGEWVPTKRVQPSRWLFRGRKKIYDCRLRLRQLSHTAWQQAVSREDFEVFRGMMRPDINRLNKCYRPPVRRLLSRIKRLFVKMTDGSVKS